VGSLADTSFEQNPPPSFLRLPPSLQIAATSFLTSLESLLLPSSLPRLSLTNLNLTTSDLLQLDVLHRAEEVLGWYLSFHSSAEESAATARSIVHSVRSLDLSKNQLTSKFQLFFSHLLPPRLSRCLSSPAFTDSLSLAALPPTLPLLLPGLETLSLSQNAFRLLPSSLALFSQLRRLKLSGNELARPGRTKLPRRRGLQDEEEWMEAAALEQKGATRSNTREVAYVVKARMGRWREGKAREGRVGAEQQGEEKGVGRKVPTLLDVSLQVANAALLAERAWDEDSARRPTADSTTTNHLASSSESCPSPSSPPVSLFDNLPPHLYHALTNSYTCTSCHTFISPLSTLDLPLPDPSPSSLASRLNSTPISLHLPPLYERLHFLSPGVNLPTQIRPPPSPPSSYAQPHHLTTEERVLLALYGRGTELTTLVVGDEVHHRFCTRCAVGHLRLLSEEGEGLEGEQERLGRECKCRGCEEERRVKGECLLSLEVDGARSEVGEGVMRWLRRRPRRLSTMRGGR
jgi:hypothetical protein